MKFGLYSIKDKATDAFAPTFVSQNNATAMRSFGDLAKDPNTQINKHPSDFCLIHVGSWDDDDGTVQTEKHKTLAWAEDYHVQQDT